MGPLARITCPACIVVLLGTALLSGRTLSAGSPCFPAVQIPNWNADNVGGFANGSSEFLAQQCSIGSAATPADSAPASTCATAAS
jgi:hypothetical protein